MRRIERVGDLRDQVDRALRLGPSFPPRKPAITVPVRIADCISRHDDNHSTPLQELGTRRAPIRGRPRQESWCVAADEIIDGLYGLPLGEFTRARNEAAGELRRAGRREEAEQVKALRKPTVAAAAVNLLVREHRREVEEFLGAAATLRDAP